MMMMILISPGQEDRGGEGADSREIYTAIIKAVTDRFIDIWILGIFALLLRESRLCWIHLVSP